jgi:hypothetical protein
MRPPEVPSRWEDCSSMLQAEIIAFEQTMSHDEDEKAAALAGAKL